MTVNEVLCAFGRNWKHLSTLGAPFTEKVDFWAGVVSRRSIRNPESFPEATLDNSIYGFIRTSSARPKYKERLITTQLNALRGGPCQAINRKFINVEALDYLGTNSTGSACTKDISIKTLADTKGKDRPHEEFVEEVCVGKTPRSSSIIRRLAQGEKIPDIAEALGISSQGVINAAYGNKGGAK